MSVFLPEDYMWEARCAMRATCLDKMERCRHINDLKHIIEEVDDAHDDIRDLIADTRHVFHRNPERMVQMDAIIEYLSGTLNILDQLHEDLRELLVESDLGRHSQSEVESCLEDARRRIRESHNGVLRNHFKDLSSQLGCRYKHMVIPEHYDVRR